MVQRDQISSARGRIEYLLEYLRLDSLAQLAEASGVSPNTIKSVMRRDAIGSKTARQLADGLQLEYSWVKTGAGSIRAKQETAPSADPSPAVQSAICITVDPWAQAAYEAKHPAITGKTERDSVLKRLQIIQQMMEIGGTSALAVAGGITPEVMKEILETDRIDDDVASLMARRFGVEYDWFRHGTGPMQARGAEIEGRIGSESDEAASKLPAARTRTPETRAEKGAVLAMVPKAQTKLSAGGGVIPEEGTTGEEYAFRMDWLHRVATSPNRVILVDVDGDSMAPTLLTKDTVLIDLGRTELRDGRIYAIAVGDVVQIKRLQRLTADRVRIISDNAAYHTYEARADEIRIIGQMIWFGRTVV